jgi:4'-phosphopantetheinyl transferase
MAGYTHYFNMDGDLCSRIKSSDGAKAGEMKFVEGQVHIWRLDLSPQPQQLETFKKLLSKDELLREGKFIQKNDRNRFTLGRGALRKILSTYVPLPAEQLVFEYGPKNKPALAEAYGEQRVSFNLSHSQDLAVIAVAPYPRRVGIDLERIREMKQIQSILDRYFSLTERTEYNALPKDKQLSAFFHLWSQKEAFVKAWGESIGSIKLDQLSLAKSWLVKDLEIETEYSCCLVAERFSPGEQLSIQSFNLKDLGADRPL